MTDIDAALARLREMPLHPRLAAIDATVLDHMATRSVSRPVPGMVFGLAALSALTFGIASAAVPGTPARAAQLAPFGTSPALAPSTLLSSAE
ncbi:MULTISPECIES: hypothetical protein [unclassified Sphingomonas]|uniref:hypothetical protein n=1 Tax=Sphingomonas TaxID=13687 RepID=UPI000964C8F1|nr:MULTISPECIES: hypothetical protein [unclassified Sphingomonas]MBN8812344.1 hypothetical protein [Sphingomonas sp.]OJY48036.1 MAG: hypothetical protein BGP17_02495 [Sphingomonas sp. 67-41]